jgi:hypothetical protein
MLLKAEDQRPRSEKILIEWLRLTKLSLTIVGNRRYILKTV